MPGLTDETPARPILPGRQPWHDLGVYGGRFGMVGDPTGGGGDRGPVEDVAGMKGRGYTLASLNAFDGEVQPNDWDVWRRECGVRELAWEWWARCYTNDDVNRLADLATRDARRSVTFNVEIELATGLVSWEHALRVSKRLIGDGLDVCWSTEGAVYGSTPALPADAWARASDAGVVVSPQAFQAANPDWTPKACVAFAHSKGCELVVPTLGAFAVGGVKPVLADYEWDGPFGVFLVNNIDLWRDW